MGSILAYGHALGRCAGIQLGKVLKVEVIYTPPTTYVARSYDYSQSRGEDGRHPLIAHTRIQPERHEYKITVWGVDNDWKHRDPRLTSRKGTLQFPERMIVIPDDKVPENIAKLLADITIESTPKSLGLK